MIQTTVMVPYRPVGEGVERRHDCDRVSASSTRLRSLPVEERSEGWNFGQQGCDMVNFLGVVGHGVQSVGEEKRWVGSWHDKSQVGQGQVTCRGGIKSDFCRKR